jgi:hypothetical protein
MRFSFIRLCDVFQEWGGFKKDADSTDSKINNLQDRPYSRLLGLLFLGRRGRRRCRKIGAEHVGAALPRSVGMFFPNFEILAFVVNQFAGFVFDRHLVGAGDVTKLAGFGDFDARRFPAHALHIAEDLFPHVVDAVLGRDRRPVRRQHDRVAGIKRDRFLEIVRARSFRPLIVGVAQGLLGLRIAGENRSRKRKQKQDNRGVFFHVPIEAANMRQRQCRIYLYPAHGHHQRNRRERQKFKGKAVYDKA